jgi:hypothetical protein
VHHDPERLPEERHRAGFGSSATLGDELARGRVEVGDAVRADGGDGTARRRWPGASGREDGDEGRNGRDNDKPGRDQIAPAGRGPPRAGTRRNLCACGILGCYGRPRRSVRRGRPRRRLKRRIVRTQET